jgi:Acetamidase/Formamidase family
MGATWTLRPHDGRFDGLLPCAVPGALFYTSDGHVAQGNGEVSIAAIEIS